MTATVPTDDAPARPSAAPPASAAPAAARPRVEAAPRPARPVRAARRRLGASGRGSSAGTHVTTDNAQVDGHITPVAPKVQAFVRRVLVEENQQVKERRHARGARRARPRGRGWRRREADLASPRDGRQRPARGPGGGAAGREPGPGRRRRGHGRVRGGGGCGRRVPTSNACGGLAATNVVSPPSSSTRRRRRMTPRSANARGRPAPGRGGRERRWPPRARHCKGADARLAAAEAAVGNARAAARVHGDHGTDRRRRRAAQGGAGELVQPGQTLLSIVPSTDVWVTANLKETELRGRLGRRPGRVHRRRLSRAAVPGHGRER